MEVTRLSFLLEEMETLRISKTELAERLGISVPSLYMIFKRDDMKVSNAIMYSERLGFEISFRLEKKGDNVKESLERIFSMTEEADRKRLAFLMFAITKYGLVKTQLARDLNIEKCAVSRWFRVDDILISNLYKIAELNNLEVVIELNRKESLV